MTQVASGFTSDYTDPNSGITITGSWAQIRYILYTPDSSCFIVIDVYKDQDSYNNGKTAIFSNVQPQVNAADPAWSTYFDLSVMDEAGKDIVSQAITYLQATW